MEIKRTNEILDHITKFRGEIHIRKVRTNKGVKRSKAINKLLLLL